MTGPPLRPTTRRHLLGGLLGAASLPLGGRARAQVRACMLTPQSTTGPFY